jgi:hypothetical protein
MTVTVEIPEKLVDAFASNGADMSRAVLEAMALEGYRRKLLGESQMRRLLGFETRMEVHGFLKEHGLYLNYGVEELEHDIRESDRIVALRGAQPPTEQRAG